MSNNLSLDNPHVKELILSNPELPLIFLSQKNKTKNLYTLIHADAKILTMTELGNSFVTKELVIYDIKKKYAHELIRKEDLDKEIEKELTHYEFFKAIVVLV